MVEKKISKKEISKNHNHNIEHTFHKFMKMSHLNQISFLFIVFLGTVMVWKGIYDILNVYWFPEFPVFSNVSSIVIGLIIVASTHYATRKIV